MSRKIPLAQGQKILPPPNRDQGDMTGAVQQLPMQQDSSEKIDVAINIFAKPYQTGFSVLSLLKTVATMWALLAWSGSGGCMRAA